MQAHIKHRVYILLFAKSISVWGQTTIKLQLELKKKSFGCPRPAARHFRVAGFFYFFNIFFFLIHFFFPSFFWFNFFGGSNLKCQTYQFMHLQGSKCVPLPVRSFQYAILYLLNLPFLFSMSKCRSNQILSILKLILKSICTSLQKRLDHPARSLDRWLTHQISFQLT